MVSYPDQGDLISVENVKFKMIVVSNRVFNAKGGVMACPVIRETEEAALHIPVESNIVNGYIQCESVKFFDLTKRSFKVIGRISLYKLMDISDALQGIFEYI